MNNYWIIIIKLGMIRFATSLLVVLITNVLNRVLIVEFQISATVIVFIFAFQHLATPSGLLAGYLSDRVDTRPRRRLPFILGGMLLSLALMPLFPYWALAFASHPQSRHLLWLGLGLFFLFGVGTTVSATAINALLVDEVPESRRGAGMTVVWIMTLLGFVIGSAFFHYLLHDHQIDRLQLIFWIFTGLALVMTLGSLIGLETPQTGFPCPFIRLAGMGRVLKSFVQSSQALVFFSFLAASVFFPAMQIFLLTPFGGEILKLTVGETAKFGMYTSYGTLLGMGLAYGWQRISPRPEGNLLLIASLLIGTAAFALLSWSAWQPQHLVGMAGVWLFGFFKGLYNAGISFLTMRLAHPAVSGVFMGLWNVISGLALAVGEMAGGLFLDLGLKLFGNYRAAYAVVFLTIGLGLLGCLILLGMIHPETFRRQMDQRLNLKVNSRAQHHDCLTTPP